MVGVVPNVSAATWPRQRSELDREVLVCFNYDTTVTLVGVIVRDDAEEPWVTIIRLNDNRYVLDTECQWRPR